MVANSGALTRHAVLVDPNESKRLQTASTRVLLRIANGFQVKLRFMMASASSSKKYQTLWILDPHLARKEKEATGGDVHWHSIELPEALASEYMLNGHCNGFIYRDRDDEIEAQPDHTWVYVHEAVCFARARL